MKTVKKKLDCSIESLSMEQMECVWGDTRPIYTYKLVTNKYIPNIETLELFVDVDEPENLKEFRTQKDLTKIELVDWLNKNYKP